MSKIYKVKLNEVEREEIANLIADKIDALENDVDENAELNEYVEFLKELLTKI